MMITDKTAVCVRGHAVDGDGFAQDLYETIGFPAHTPEAQGILDRITDCQPITITPAR